MQRREHRRRTMQPHAEEWRAVLQKSRQSSNASDSSVDDQLEGPNCPESSITESRIDRITTDTGVLVGTKRIHPICGRQPHLLSRHGLVDQCLTKSQPKRRKNERSGNPCCHTGLRENPRQPDGHGTPRSTQFGFQSKSS